MTYQTFESVNTTAGMHTLFIYVNEVTNGTFIPLILFGFFMIVMLGNYFAQKRLSGVANFPVSFTVAAFVTLILSFLFSLIPDLTNIWTTLVCLAATIIGILWLMFPGDN